MTTAEPGTANEGVRLDRWLFSVRIFKSRSLAAKAIAGGKIKVNGAVCKAHRPLKIGDQVVMREEGRTLSYEVLGLLEKRVGAKEAAVCYKLTVDADVPEAMRELLQIYRDQEKRVPRPKGRPTKRDRRLIDRLRDE